jgi:secreted trypsin-like serine protease
VESAGHIGLIKLATPSTETPIDNVLHPSLDETVRCHPGATSCVSRAKNDTAGACNGDSGSPLLWKVNGVWRLVGVDSHSGGESGCLATDVVYTTTEFYWSWSPSLTAQGNRRHRAGRYRDTRSSSAAVTVRCER